MTFKDNADDDEEEDDDMDVFDDEDDDIDDFDDDDDLAVAGDLELDDEDAERRRKLRKEKLRLKLKREGGSPHRRPSETDEEDWQSMGAESLRRTTMAITPTFAGLGPSAVPNPAVQAAQDPTGFYGLDRHPAASAKAATSSLRNTPLTANGIPADSKGLGGREEDAIAALVQLRSYS